MAVSLQVKEETTAATTDSGVDSGFKVEGGDAEEGSGAAGPSQGTRKESSSSSRRNGDNNWFTGKARSMWDKAKNPKFIIEVRYTKQSSFSEPTVVCVFSDTEVLCIQA
jgi:hypothetical protein